MTLPLRRETCIYCGSGLIPDPANPQWCHCPKCAPTWTDHIRDMTAYRAFQGMRATARDMRGAPGVKPATP